VRDRVTWLIYAQLGLFGYFLYGFGPVVPLLRDEQGVSLRVASLHGTGIAIGALAGGALFPVLARRYGRGTAMWTGMLGLGAGVAILCLAHPVWLTVGATVAIATFGIVVVSGVTASLADKHGPAGPAAIAEANAVCAGMGVLAPLVIGLTVQAELSWRPGLAVVVGLIVALALVAFFSGVRLPSGDRVLATEPGARERLPGRYWVAWVLMCVTGSVEVCLSLWAVEVLRGHAGMATAPAAAAVSGVVGGMFLGRWIGSRIALRVAPAPFLYVALGISVAGFAVFWLATDGWLATFGLLVLGLGNAMHYPLGIAIALRTAPGRGDLAAARASYGIAVCFGLAPVALGAIADDLGPHPAFLLVPALLAVAALLVFSLRSVGRGVVGGGVPQVGDADAQLLQQVAEQRQGKADDVAVVALDPFDERAAQPVDRERAGHP